MPDSQSNPGLLKNTRSRLVVWFASVLLVQAGSTHFAIAQVRPTPELRTAVDNFLSAIADNDTGKLRLLSTKKGYQLIVRALNNHREASKMLRVIGAENATSRIRWLNVTDTFARGKVKFVLIDFIVQSGKWKFNNATLE